MSGQQVHDLAVTRESVAALHTYARNPRQGDVKAIRQSLEVNGQYRPIVVNRGTHTGRVNEVLAGNHTLMAARDAGWSDVSVCWVDVDNDHAARIVAADNRTADLGEYDQRLLIELLSDLPDLDGTGYDPGDVEDLVRQLDDRGTAEGNTDPDDVPEVPPTAVTRLGDVWLLGTHRVLCGDGTDVDDMERVTEGRGPGIVHTDPPYGISIVRRSRIGAGGPFGGTIGAGKIVPTTKFRPILGDDSADVAVKAFRVLTERYPSVRHVWWGGNHYAASAGLDDASCWLVWDKENGDTKFADAELAWTNYPGSVRLIRHLWNGMLRASERTKRIHPTQKPVAVVNWALSKVDPDQSRGTVLDVFGGSGSTLIAAHQTERTAWIIELDPLYCDVICRRWQEFTGTLPVLEKTGEPHDFRVEVTADGEE